MDLQISVVCREVDKNTGAIATYLCKNDDCINTAIKRKAFNRACRTDLDTDEVKRVIEEAFNNN